MRKRFLFPVILTLLVVCGGVFADNSFPGDDISLDTVIDLAEGGFGTVNTNSDTHVDEDAGSIKVSGQHEVVNPGSDSALVLVFDTKDTWHYYADKKQVPTGQLTVTPSGKGVVFGKVVYPKAKEYDDKVFNNTYGIYDGKFKVYVPFKVEESSKGSIRLAVKIDGAVCAEMCKFLTDVELTTTINVDPDAVMGEVAFKLPDGAGDEEMQVSGSFFSMLWTYGIAFGMALIAGLVLNVMPCIWPILPIIISRLWNLSGKSRAKSIGMGVGFSLGILLFFAIIAGANIILRIGYGTVMPWGEFNRFPGFNIGLSMLMIVMGLFMFGVFQFTLPASVSNKAGAGEGFSGSVGMGFLMALLSTPCGFGVLAAAFVWAQSQGLWLATFTIMLIGVGMALPYILLTSIPGLINRMPKPGGWMEQVKYFLGFVMLFIAVKMLSAVPSDMRISVLYFAVFLSLAVWIWGWVTMSTSGKQKYIIRIVAVLIAVGSGWLFLPDTSGKTEKPVDWLKYDAAAIAKDIKDGKPVLIKFTADWCMTCSVIDKVVYSKKEVGDFLKQRGVRTYLGDTTLRGSASTKDLSGVYKELAVPVTVIFLPDGKEERLRGMYTKGTLFGLLESLDDVDHEESFEIK